MVNQVKRKPTERKRIFANYTSDGGLLFRLYKELKKQPPNKQPVQKLDLGPEQKVI